MRAAIIDFALKGPLSLFTGPELCSAARSQLNLAEERRLRDTISENEDPLFLGFGKNGTIKATHLMTCRKQAKSKAKK